jgi:hypothetical protein
VTQRMSRFHPPGYAAEVLTLAPALPCLAVLGLAGCTSIFYDDRCGEETRNVQSAADLLESQDTVVSAVLDVGETRADGSRSVRWTIGGDNLRGHTQGARLVASEDTSVLLFPLPGGPAEPNLSIEGELMPYAGPVPFDQLFERARRSGLTVIVDTDLPGKTSMVLPLQAVIINDWAQPHCS